VKKLIVITLIGVLSRLSAQPQAPQTVASPPTAAVVGTAVIESTGQPLSKAYIDLRGPVWLSTTTEDDGRFYFPKVQPGQYHLYARREGYALTEFGQRWSGGPGQLITLTAGDPVPDVKLGLIPTSVISGHITDMNGNPITGARVRAMKSAVQENRRTLRVAQEAVTNELGEYRLFWMAPGRYYVSATVQAWQVNSQIVNNPSAPVGDTTNAGLSASRTVSRPVTTKPIGTGIADDEVYIPIYFPRSTDGEQAAAIDVQSGMELRGIDISVGPVHTFHVRGRITDIPAPSATAQNAGGGRAAPPLPVNVGGRAGPGAAGGPGIQVRLAPDNWFGNVYSAQANATTGEFDFPKVVNGGYTLYTFIDGTTTRMPLEVRNADVDGVTMQLATGVSLPVQISLDGEAPKSFPDVNSLQIMLYRDPTLINAPAMNASSRGSSPLPNLSPGNYRIYVQPLLSPLNGTAPLIPPTQWQSAYVKSITIGDEEVLNAGLHYVPKPDSVLNVVIGTNPGTLEGRVLNDQQQIVTSAAVMLFAENPTARITRTDMFKVTSTDVAGRFQVKGLPPGDYKVFAWEGLEKDAWLDPEFARNEGRGQVVHVKEGMVQSVDVPAIRPVP